MALAWMTLEVNTVSKVVNDPQLGFVTGTGIPMVIRSQVPWVWVQFWYLAHRDISYLYRGVMGISWVYYVRVTKIFIVLKLIFSHI
jgi:hypothetical protein